MVENEYVVYEHICDAFNISVFATYQIFKLTKYPNSLNKKAKYDRDYVLHKIYLLMQIRCTEMQFLGDSFPIRPHSILKNDAKGALIKCPYVTTWR